jgi:molecular chaperone HscC
MVIVGIDLGTTNSLVAVLRDGKPETLPNELGEHLTPSAVAIAEDGALLVGRAAWDRLVVKPDAGQAFFKRDMGMTKAYRFGGRPWTPVECSALVLTEMRRIAQLQLGAPVREAVITVPAYFRETQRQATINAAHLAGLSVARVVNEPTAAALAYGFADPGVERKVLVFDLGGGTFDVTVLEMFSGVVEVRATAGDSRLGGEDYTDALLDRLLRQCGVVAAPTERGRMRAQIEALKRKLSVHERAWLVLGGHELAVSRQDLAAAGAALTARLRPLVLQCLHDARMAATDLDAVLLVGGASRMHAVQEHLRTDLGRPLLVEVDPDRVVALGAAVQAALCSQDAAVADLVLTDVCSHTLGISTSREFVVGQRTDGYFAPIIERNSTVPISRAKTFSALSSSQDVVTLEVFQGEARMTKDNHRLGTLEVKGLRRPHPEVGSFEVRFTYDMSGLLEVDVTVLDTRAMFHAVIEDRPGNLSAAQIQEIRARLAPLKIAPRDQVQNRARLERANRLFERLLGESRAELEHALYGFEAALASGNEAEWEEAGHALDAFMGEHTFEDGEWQPPASDESSP